MTADEEVRREGRSEDEDTIADRFMARVFRHLLQAFLAKDKTIRYRAVHIVGEMLPHVGLMEYVNYIDVHFTNIDQL